MHEHAAEHGIRIIITGGTFDKAYDALRGELSFRTSHLPGIIDTLNLTVPVSLEINQLRDSLDMTDEDRARIVEACRHSKERLIIVTHGTDTMTVTAELLQRELSPTAGKTVVLTGAMVPYSVNRSDALFNLGTAVAAVQLLETGVFISMNGRIHPAGRVQKNREKGVFETSESGS